MSERPPLKRTRATKPRDEQLDFKVESFARDERERQRNRTGRLWRMWHLHTGSKLLQVWFPLVVAAVALLAYALLARSTPRTHGIPVAGHPAVPVPDASGTVLNKDRTGK